MDDFVAVTNEDELAQRARALGYLATIVDAIKDKNARAATVKAMERLSASISTDSPPVEVKPIPFVKPTK